MRYRFIVQFLLLITLSIQGFSSFSQPTVLTLQNGLTLVVLKSERAPVVTQMIWFRAGTIDNDRNNAAAHFLEHIMFSPQDGSSAQKLNTLIDASGGRVKALTTKDFTYYYETVADGMLEEIMKLEAARMAELLITPDMIEKERQYILKERRQRLAARPLEQLYESVNAKLFGPQLYGIPVLGTEDAIKSIQLDYVKSYYDQHYGPNNAIVFIMGQVDVEQVKVLADKYYGVIPARGQPRRFDQSKLKTPVQDKNFKIYADIEHSYINRTYAAPNFQTSNHRYVYALQLLKYILGDEAIGLLYKDLVIQQKLLTTLNVDYKDYAVQPRTFSITVELSPTCDHQKFNQKLNQAFKQILKTKITLAQLNQAKALMRAEIDLIQDNLFKIAHVLGQRLAAGETLDEIQAWPERVAAVTVDQVNEALVYLLSTDQYVTGYLLPSSSTKVE